MAGILSIAAFVLTSLVCLAAGQWPRVIAKGFQCCIWKGSTGSWSPAGLTIYVVLYKRPNHLDNARHCCNLTQP